MTGGSLGTAAGNAPVRWADPEGWRYQPLVAVAVAWALGITLAAACGGPSWIWWSAPVVAGLVWCWIGERRPVFAGVLVLAAVVGLGGLWHQRAWRDFSADDLGRFSRREGRPAAVEVTIEGAPVVYATPEFDPLRAFSPGPRTRLLARAARLRDGDRWRPVAGRVQVDVDGELLGLAPGDRLRVFGRLSTPPRRLNPGSLDPRALARDDRRLCRLDVELPAAIERLAAGGLTNGRAALARLRSAAGDALWRALDRPRAGLAAALLLGLREELDESQTEAFFRTGTVHVLAISGMHLGLLVASLWWILRFEVLPERMGLAVIALVAAGYALLTDAEPPVVRAAVGTLVVCGARWLRRPVGGFQLLALAALVVLVAQPRELFRAGTQLSFLCVATLLVAARVAPRRPPADPLDELIRRTRPWPRRALRWALAQLGRGLYYSTAVWLATLPLVAERFHQVAPVAILLNLLVWLPVAGAMSCGFVVLTCGWLVPPLGQVAAAGCDFSLGVLESLVSAGSTWPGAGWWVPGPGPLGALLGYGLLAGWAVTRNHPRGRRACAVGFGLVVLSCWWPARGWQRESGLTVTALAVGHGSANVLELPGGRTVLYDAGQLGSPVGCARTVSGYLWSRGITHLDAVVVSHADVDHFSGLPRLLERFAIGEVLVPAPFEFTSASTRALGEALARHGVPLRRLSVGEKLALDALVTLEVLHPPRAGVPDASDNAQSLVLGVAAPGGRALLTGDLEPPGTELLLARPPWRSDLLVAPHHGSPRSNPPGLAAWCRPRYVVISGGFTPEVAQVRGGYEAAGMRVLHTSADGAIRFRASPGGQRCEHFDGANWVPASRE